MWALMRSPRWVGFLVFALVLVAICLLAARWQLGRWQTKLDRRAEVQAAANAEPSTLRGLAQPNRAVPAASEYRLAQVRGTYDAAGQILVRNPLGRSGFEVVTPLVLDDGSVLFIDRGWVPQSPIAAATSPEVPPPPTQEVTATVRLRLPRPEQARAGAPAGQVYGFDVASWDAAAAGPSYRAYGELVAQQPAPAAGIQLPDPPDVSLGPHLFYTFQWVFFAGLALVGYVLLLRREASTEDQDRLHPATSTVTIDPSGTDA